jgi:NhaA family Na+:H+ antiporter
MNRPPTQRRRSARWRQRLEQRALLRFLKQESSSGVLLAVAAVAALLWANSPWSDSYDDLWQTKLTLGSGDHALSLSLQHWVNDALMTIFFLVVGLEINREFTSGHLRGRRAATLPVVAALGGMVVPALLYLAIAGSTDASGWGIPMATDIALALGVVALVGKSLPTSLRAFLLGLAVVDDIGAIIVIAIFYSSGVEWEWLGIAVAALAGALVGRRFGLNLIPAYVVLGAVMWFALHEAGIHPTLAGVAMGLAAPAAARFARHDTPLIEHLEHRLHPWSSFLIVPVFALANSGVDLGSGLGDALSSPVAWGVLVGLLVGKPLGVVILSRLAVRARWADAPAGTSPRQLLGAGHAAGIGFTVALFIAELAFDDPDLVAEAKIAILVASVVSGLVAAVVLRRGSAGNGSAGAQSASSPSTEASPSR